jgi:GAF domain-containing protein
MKPVYYSPARRPDDEDERQNAVNASGFFAAVDDPVLIEIVRQAAVLFGTPMAAISIIDHDRQWFPVEMGIGVRETPRAASFCAHAILDPANPLHVGDASADPRFAGNPLVLAAPNIRFYVGAPLIDTDGHALGALCVFDDNVHVPVGAAALEALAILARQAIAAAAARRGDAKKAAGCREAT